MWRLDTNTNNPFYMHLTRTWEDTPAELSWLSMMILFGPGLCLAVTVTCLFCNALSVGFASLFFYAVPLGILAVFLTPMGLGISATHFVAHHAGNEDFDLVLLTNLTEAQLVGSYWGTITHRLRWNGTALAPPFPYTLMLIAVFLSMIFFGSGEFPIFILVMVVGYLGWYWSSQMLGLSLGLGLRHQKFVTEISAGIMLILTGLWGWGLLQVGQFLSDWLFGIYPILARQIVFMIVWLLAPLAIGMIAARLAYYFVRNPLGARV